MQMLFKRESGYLTVYLSLVFTVILSLLLALVEGAAMGAARLQAELVADLGMDSVFAEYHRELFRQYGLFFIDDSYGTSKGSIAKTEKHLAEYMSYNLNPKKGLQIPPGSNWVSLENPYLEIEEAAFATDEAGAVFKAQAIAYMKSRYGLDIIEGIKDQLETVEQEQLLSKDMEEMLTKYREEFEAALETEEIEETGKETNEGFSYDGIVDFFDSLAGNGILNLVIASEGSISDAAINCKEYVGYRAEHKNINKGSGLPEYIEKPEGIVNELMFDEFLLEKYGFYGEEKENSHLQYQIEYILYGRDSDISNLRECAERLFMLRCVSNYLYLTSIDTAKYKEAKAVSVAISALICLPEIAEVLTQIIVVVWAMAEAVVDVKSLYDGGKIPLIKAKGDWQLGLTGILSGVLRLGEKNKDMTQTSGISYEGYLRILLGVMLQKGDKVMRSMDIVEMDIRKTAGNDSFRIDQCVDYLKVSFGFRGDRGQEYVFTRTMRYE